LKGCLYHYTYDDLSDQIMTQNRFSTISSRGLYEDHRRFSGLDLVFRPTFRFIKGYILKRGFMDGYRGFIIALLIAAGVFFKYAKLWELTFIKRQEAGGKGPQATMNPDERNAPVNPGRDAIPPARAHP